MIDWETAMNDDEEIIELCDVNLSNAAVTYDMEHVYDMRRDLFDMIDDFISWHDELEVVLDNQELILQHMQSDGTPAEDGDRLYILVQMTGHEI